MRISDWSSDVCSSDLRISVPRAAEDVVVVEHMPFVGEPRALLVAKGIGRKPLDRLERRGEEATAVVDAQRPSGRQRTQAERARDHRTRSETTVRLKDCPSVTRRSLRRTTRQIRRAKACTPDTTA